MKRKYVFDLNLKMLWCYLWSFCFLAKIHVDWAIMKILRLKHYSTWVSMKWVDFSGVFCAMKKSRLARNIMFGRYTEESDRNIM